MAQTNKQNLLCGLLVVFSIGTLAWWLAQFAPRIGSITIAIVLGVFAGNVLFSNQTGAEGATFAEKNLLPVAIVLLGVELQLVTLLSLGPVAAVVILTSIASSVLVSIQLGKLLGFSPGLSVLMGAGNGICGSSAVAATSIAIEADESDTGISISVVNLLGTIGIFLMPTIISLFSLSDLEGGLLVGGTLQAFGQVVAAGFAVNDDVGNIATVVKMGRVLMLGPMVVILGTWMQSQTVSEEKSKVRVRVPRFIIGFVIVSIIASLDILSPEILSLFKTSGKYLLVIAMAGIGMKIQLRTLFRSGVRALLFGGAISVVQIVITLIAIMLIV